MPKFNGFSSCHTRMIEFQERKIVLRCRPFSDRSRSLQDLVPIKMGHWLLRAEW